MNWKRKAKIDNRTVNMYIHIVDFTHVLLSLDWGNRKLFKNEKLVDSEITKKRTFLVISRAIQTKRISNQLEFFFPFLVNKKKKERIDRNYFTDWNRLKHSERFTSANVAIVAGDGGGFLLRFFLRKARVFCFSFRSSWSCVCMSAFLFIPFLICEWYTFN